MSYVPAGIRAQIADLGALAVRDFDAGKWLQLGLLTGSDDIIRGHERLLRSLRFGDDDYSGCTLEVLLRIVEREDANFAIIKNFIEAGSDGPVATVSTAPSKNRKIVFAPNVFDVPNEDVNPRLVAVMMPFSPEFEPVFGAIKAACEWNRLECLRVKDIWESSAIIQDVFSLIFRASVVVCDFSGRNPNVFYEAGIAHTLGKHVIPLSQSKDDVPFDVAHHRYLPYLKNGEGLAALTTDLQKRLYTLAGRDEVAQSLSS